MPYVVSGFSRTVFALAIALLALHAATWLPALWAIARTLQVPPRSSIAALAAAALMLGISRVANRRWRLAGAAAVLVAFLGATIAAPLAFEQAGVNYMGDGVDFATSRPKFEANIPLAGDRPALHFKAHLGDSLLAIVDRAFGRTAQSPAIAYEVVSRLGGLLYVIELLVVLAAWRGSRRAFRFAALALALPVTVGFFGYYELGYLAVSAAAFPLLMRAWRTRLRTATARHDWWLNGAAMVQGLHAALHGIGLLGIAGGVLASARSGGPARWYLRPLRFAAFAVAAYLGWIVIYVVGLGLGVDSDPAASNIAIRGLTETSVFDRRIMHPLLSWNAVFEIGATGLAVGVVLLAAGLLAARRHDERLIALLYALPGLAYLVLWWPSLGVSHDMDLLLGAFPAGVAAAWLISRTPHTAMVGLVLLAVTHVLFWSVVANRALERVWI